jgi:hypothetical protein
MLCVLAHNAVPTEKADPKSKTDACLTNGAFMLFIGRKFRGGKQLLPSAAKCHHPLADTVHNAAF